MKKHWKDIFENTLNEADNSKANQLHYAISTAIFNIDENMSYKDFAAAVALMLKDDYGTHNYKPFIKELEKQLKQ